MAGEAIVTIRERQWRVYLATTPWELMSGLAGATSINPGTGMLFDLGYETRVTVTTVPLRFPIDIAFICNDLIIVDIARNIPPGHLMSSDLPARYFLEVNAGELSGVSTGDIVGIESLPLEVPTDVLSQFVSGLVTFALAALVMSLAVGLVTALVKAALASPEREMLPQTRESKVIPVKRRLHREGELEYLADSPEFLAQTIEDIGYREKIDSAFRDAIARAKKEG